ncbi:hypothetical protein Kisp01_39170 [Kineosporia sp. NBRC 101677]|uniref:hypothetical protein n=1 Tax=Kineosporia sp. NBRC 101677 TaxID=3032197 RepID=UPI0024A4A47C|nr:hypothetical protein [Kineosporia sp. NBRC 101677]GLY16902.1 hypothetical protein Kisp01_39170 [Kineosporia sp. NBRC 101677]
MSGAADTSDRPLDLPPTSAQRRLQRSGSTRYLSAGTYLDADFRNAVLDEFLGRRDRAVAPAFSTDAVPVVRHALNARRHQIVRDAVLTAVLVVFLVIQAKILLAVLALVVTALLLWRALKAVARLRFGTAVAHVGAALISLLVALLFLESHSNLFSSIDGSTGYEETDSFGSVLVQTLGVLLVVLGSAWTAVVVERLANRQIILDRLMPRRFVPSTSPTGPKKHQARLRYIAEAQSGNVTYYPPDASERPFVGAGTVQRSWTQAVPLIGSGSDPGSGEPELTTDSLRDALSRDLARLHDTGPQNEVSVQDRLVTPAAARADDPRTDAATGLLQHRLTPEQMELLAEADSAGVHRYLSVRMAPGHGDSEIWVFVRCLVEAQTLHLDVIGCSLPPVRPSYREVDQYTPSDLGVVLRTAVSALPEVPGLLLRAPLRLFLALIGQDHVSWDLRSRMRQLGSAATTGRGARAGVRELGTDQESPDLLAGMATQRQIRLIEQQVVDTVAESMERSGFSAEEFRRRTRNQLDGPAQ